MRLNQLCRVLVRATILIGAACIAPASSGQRLSSISSAEFERYVHWLDLDSDRATLAKALYDDYRSRWEAEFLPKVRQIHDLVPAAFELGHAEAMREHGLEYRAIVSELGERDEAFFQTLESLVSIDSLNLMARVRLGRQRILWDAGSGELPGGQADLIDMVESLELTPGEREAVDEFIASFEPQFVEALRAAERKTGESYELFYARQPVLDEIARVEREKPADSEDRLRELRDQLVFLIGARADVAFPPKRALLQLNLSARETLKGLLSDGNAALFERMFLEESYRYVYPDPAHAGFLFDECINKVGDDAVLRESIDRLRTDFERKWSSISDEMAQSLLRRVEWLQRGEHESTIRASEEIIEFHLLGWKRERWNEEQAAILKSILTPEQFALLPEWDFEKHPPKRPWNTHKVPPPEDR